MRRVLLDTPVPDLTLRRTKNRAWSGAAEMFGLERNSGLLLVCAAAGDAVLASFCCFDAATVCTIFSIGFRLGAALGGRGFAFVGTSGEGESSRGHGQRENETECFHFGVFDFWDRSKPVRFCDLFKRDVSV